MTENSNDEDLREISERWGMVLAPGQEAETMDLFLRELARRVDELRLSDPRKFSNTLYRLDVNEHKIRTVLKEAPASLQGLEIAKLILERELQKARTRRQYKAPTES